MKSKLLLAALCAAFALPAGAQTVTLHGASATTWTDTPGNKRVAAPLLEAPIRIWSTSFILA